MHIEGPDGASAWFPDPPNKLLQKIAGLQKCIAAVLNGGTDRETIDTAVRNWTGVPTTLPDGDTRVHADGEYQDDDPNLSELANIALRRDEIPPLIVNGRLYPDEPRRAAADVRAKWAARAALKLLPEASDITFDALYPLLKLVYRIGQISKALRDLLLVTAHRGAIGRLFELGPSVLSGHASPSLVGDTGSVGDGAAPEDEQLQAPHPSGADHPDEDGAR